jgi:hypothetical protein
MGSPPESIYTISDKVLLEDLLPQMTYSGKGTFILFEHQQQQQNPKLYKI